MIYFVLKIQLGYKKNDKKAQCMKINIVDKKITITAFMLAIIILASFCSGAAAIKIKQKFETKSEIKSAGAQMIKEGSRLIYAANDKKSTYFSFSAFDEKFYGPFDKENVKDGDFYIKLSILQGSGGYSSLKLFDKNRKLIEINAGEKNTCDFGRFLYFNGNIYMERGEELYKINPELDFACFPLLKHEYDEISVK